MRTFTTGAGDRPGAVFSSDPHMRPQYGAAVAADAGRTSSALTSRTIDRNARFIARLLVSRGPRG